MKHRPGFGAIVAESVRTATTQPVATIATMIMIAGMCTAVLLTNGRAVAAENQVVAAIDDVGTRAIVVRAEEDSGLRSDVVAGLSRVEGVEWVGGFGTARDVENAAFHGGARAPLRQVWSEDLSVLGVAPPSRDVAATAWLAADSLSQLGFAAPAGAVRNIATDQTYGVGGELHRPSYLSFLDPLVVAPAATDEPGRIAVLVVIAADPALVQPLSAVVQSALEGVDPSSVKIQTSQQLAALRALIKGQLGDSGRSLVALVFTATAILVGAVQFGFVMLRRKDFGRRRALGASQRLILALLLLQTSLVAAVGAITGSAIAISIMWIVGDPLPNPAYAVALAILAVFVGALASLLPAIAAARREPIHELRVP